MDGIKEISVVRIYYRYGERVQGLSFWKRLLNNSLGNQLLKKAKEMNIHHANIFTAKAGYLMNENINFNISEIPPSKNPVCLELVDTAEKLHGYLEANRELLAAANIVLINNECFEIVKPVQSKE